MIPAFFELLGVMLQSQVRFAGRASLAEDDAVEPVVADHAAPKGVVEIEDQTFLRQSALSGQDAGDQIAVKGRGLRSDFQLALKPAPDVEPCVDSVALAGAGDIEQQNAILRRRLAQLIVEPRDDARRGSGNDAIIAAEQRLAHVEEGLLNDRRVADLARLAPERPQIADKSGDRFVDLRDRRRERNAGDRFSRGQREQHSLRRKLMQGRPRIEKLLAVLPVCSAMDVDQQFAGAGRQPGSRAIDDRRSRKQGWRAAPAQNRALPSGLVGQCAIELDRFQKPKSMTGEDSQAFQTFSRLGFIQRRAQISAEITRNRQPAHHRRTWGGGICMRNDRLQRLGRIRR